MSHYGGGGGGGRYDDRRGGGDRYGGGGGGGYRGGQGGYGSNVRDHLGDCGITAPVVRIGWPDQFIEHASSVGYLREKHGLTGANTAEKIRQALGYASEASAKPNMALGNAFGG